MKSVVTPDRLASSRTLTRELQANQGEGESRYPVNARPVLLILFVRVLHLFVGVVVYNPAKSHGPLRRLREAYPGPLSAQRAGQSLARQVRAVLRVQM